LNWAGGPAKYTGETTISSSAASRCLRTSGMSSAITHRCSGASLAAIAGCGVRGSPSSMSVGSASASRAHASHPRHGSTHVLATDTIDTTSSGHSSMQAYIS